MSTDETRGPTPDGAKPVSSRPLDTWRVCNRSLEQGCTCPPGGASAAVHVAARKRLEGEL